MVLDQEIRTLSSYLTNTASWSIRDKMARISQIATLLNLERVSDLMDLYNPNDESDIALWRLTPNEMRTILALRTDFKLEDIKMLKL